MKTLYNLVIDAVLLLITLSETRAEYCSIGKITGNVCKGFVIESCKFVRVDALKDDEGNLFAVKSCYRNVSTYKEENGRCWINTKSKGGGALSWAKNALSQPNFLHKNKKGKYEEIDVEYLTFKCVKR